MWKFLSKWRYPKIIQVIGSDMLISMGKSMAWASGLLRSWHWLGSCRGVHRCHTPWPWPPWSGRWEPVLTHTISIVIQALKHPFWASYPLISCMPPPHYMQFWDVLGLHHGSSWRSCKKRWAHCTRFPDSQCLFDEAMFRNSGRCLPYFSNLI